MGQSMTSSATDAVLRELFVTGLLTDAADAIGNPERHMRKASHHGSKQQ